MNSPKTHNSLMEIVDEAFELVNNRIDVIRDNVSSGMYLPIGFHMDFLKDLRSLLMLAENFRDE